MICKRFCFDTKELSGQKISDQYLELMRFPCFQLTQQGVLEVHVNTCVLTTAALIGSSVPVKVATLWIKTASLVTVSTMYQCKTVPTGSSIKQGQNFLFIHVFTVLMCRWIFVLLQKLMLVKFGAPAHNSANRCSRSR